MRLAKSKFETLLRSELDTMVFWVLIGTPEFIELYAQTL